MVGRKLAMQMCERKILGLVRKKNMKAIQSLQQVNRIDVGFSKNPQALSQHILGGWAAMTTSPYSNTELNWAKSQPGNASWERLREVFADIASIFFFQKNWFIYQSLEHSPSWIKLPNLTIWIFLVVMPENYSEFIGREFPQRPSLVRDWKF